MKLLSWSFLIPGRSGRGDEPPEHAKAQGRSERGAGTGAAVRAKIGAWHSVAGTTRRRNMDSAGQFLWSPETTRVAEEAEGATRSSSSGGGSSTGRWQTTQRPGEAKKQATAGAAGRQRRVLGRRRGWRHCPSLRVAWKRDEWSRDMMVFAGTPDDADWWRRGRGQTGTNDGGEAREERRTRRTGRWRRCNRMGAAMGRVEIGRREEAVGSSRRKSERRAAYRQGGLRLVGHREKQTLRSAGGRLSSFDIF